MSTKKIIMTDITGIGDPQVLPYCGKYYLYCTNAKDGFRVFVSNNLIDWEDAGYCYRASDTSWAYNSFWAPEVIFYNGKFIMHYSGRDKRTDSLRMNTAVADNPLGPFIDVEPLPIFDFGYAAIDGSCFIDDDGQGYFYYSRDCSQNVIDDIHTSQIYVVKLDSEMLRPVGEPKLLLTPEGDWERPEGNWIWNEGPVMLKNEGKYYLSYSSNFYASKRYSVGYAVSDNPLGPFKKAEENPILKYIDGVISGPGHNHYFKTKEGELYTAYHVHTDINNPSGNRRVCFSKARFENGKLVIDYKD